MKTSNKAVKESKGFSYIHFPIGTKCEVHVGRVHAEPIIVEVSKLHKTGPQNYLIQTTIPCELTEFKMYNISHVTRIIERGTGSAVIDQQRNKEAYKAYKEREMNQYFDIPNIKGVIVTGEPRRLIHYIATKYLKQDMLFDATKMFTLLTQQGIIVEHDVEEFGYAFLYTISKKRLHKAFKQLLNKCLISHSKTQKKEDEEQRISDLKDMESEMEFARERGY